MYSTANLMHSQNRTLKQYIHKVSRGGPFITEGGRDPFKATAVWKSNIEIDSLNLKNVS